MDLHDKRLLVIGGAGLIGSNSVDALLEEPVAEIRIFDNMTRGRRENLADALKDDRVKIFSLGGDILHQTSCMKRCRVSMAFSTLPRSGCCIATIFRGPHSK